MTSTFVLLSHQLIVFRTFIDTFHRTFHCTLAVPKGQIKVQTLGKRYAEKRALEPCASGQPHVSGP